MSSLCSCPSSEPTLPLTACWVPTVCVGTMVDCSHVCLRSPLQTELAMCLPSASPAPGRSWTPKLSLLGPAKWLVWAQEGVPSPLHDPAFPPRELEQDGPPERAAGPLPACHNTLPAGTFARELETRPSTPGSWRHHSGNLSLTRGGLGPLGRPGKPRIALLTRAGALAPHPPL
jgi:hypothetical protein